MPGSRLRGGAVAILDVPKTETEPRGWLPSKLSILRSSYESWRVIWFFYLQSLGRGEEQEMGKEGMGFTHEQGRDASATNFLHDLAKGE